ARVDARVAAPVNLEVPGFGEPVSGLLLTLPQSPGAPNQLYLRRGRLPAADEDSTVAVNESFADAQHLKPGNTLYATISGKRKLLTIAGVVLSPEFVYLIRPGDFFPDYKRFGVLWMNRRPLQAAYGMDGAFNDVVLKLAPGAAPSAVIARLDAVLAHWGGTGAITRADQTSHHYLMDETRQLQTQAMIVPVIFLGVAAFLLNVVVSRLIHRQRMSIAILKAFGYGNLSIALHYLKLVTGIVLVGGVIGIAAGAWLAHGLSNIYAEFFRYPYMHYVLKPGVALTGLIASALAAYAGTLASVLRAARLPPAQAMYPETPPVFHETLLERAGFKRLLSQAGRMILRHIARQPLKSALTLLGVALACAIVTLSGLFHDAVNYMIDVQFNRMRHADLTVTFTDTASSRAIAELKSLPSVVGVEPLRAVPVLLRNEYRSYRTALQGYVPGGRLNELLNVDLHSIRLPRDGVLLTDYLAARLGVAAGDRLQVDVLAGARRKFSIPVAGVIKEYAGANAYMSLAAMQRVLPEDPGISGAFLRVQPGTLEQVYAELKRRPKVAGVTIRAVAIHSFHELMAQNILIYATVMLIMAGTIAIGVVYNSTRIALSERAFELATLRVLGLTHREIAYILLGESALLTLLAIPAGFAIGYGFAAYLAHALASALYRVPLVLEAPTFARAALVVLAAATVSSVYVYQRLGRLDLVAVLKVRE
ncbi:MAG: ABC transporter permease, partial [Gammaproteobacteria bacterium]|nr:ABC transporter permease [Gammaproteobacteria bacterium]